MNLKKKSLVAIDHEYIASDAVQGKIPGERPDVKEVYCEIMQIGACKLNENGQEVGVLNITVKAHNIEHIPVWLSEMTGMTESRRALGIPYKEALQQLIDFIGEDAEVWTFNGDWWVVEGNIKAHNLTMPFSSEFGRFRPEMQKYDVTLHDFEQAGFKEMCSGGLYKVLGIELPSIEGVGAHDAAHDARSLAHSIYYLQNK